MSGFPVFPYRDSKERYFSCSHLSIYNTVQRGKHTRIQSLLVYETFIKLMGVAPAKIIFVVILSFKVAFVGSPNIIIVTKKVNKQV